MNRSDLHNIPGFHPASLIAAAAYLRTQLSRPKGLTETTAIVKNEGRMNGYLDAIDDLIAAASKLPEPAPKKEYQAYSQPSENQNKP